MVMSVINWELYWYTMGMFTILIAGVILGVSAWIGNRKITRSGHVDTMAGDDGA
jgi:uncharacterized membrane protein YvlD (DUF360 family)